MLVNYGEYNTFVAYETNITNFPKFYSKKFHLEFITSFGKKSEECYLKKDEINPLLIICRAITDETWLKIEEEINLDTYIINII